MLDNTNNNNVFFNLDEQIDISQIDYISSRKILLADFLPQTLNESILIISWNHIAARNLVETHNNIIYVESMSENNALTLLKTRISVSKLSDIDERVLVQVLECILLAITQAGAYIWNRASQVTTLIYLELFC